MAYTGIGRSNWFRTTDEKKLTDLVEHLDGASLSSRTYPMEGQVYCIMIDDLPEGGLNWIDPINDESNLDYFLDELQKILPEDEAFIYTEAGHDKLRYITGASLVLTSKSIDWIDLYEDATAIAQKHIGPDYQPDLTF